MHHAYAAQVRLTTFTRSCNTEQPVKTGVQLNMIWVQTMPFYFAALINTTRPGASVRLPGFILTRATSVAYDIVENHQIHTELMKEESIIRVDSFSLRIGLVSGRSTFSFVTRP